LSHVAINTVNSAGTALSHLTELGDAVHNNIRERAYTLFVARGGQHGHDLDDWFAAEKALSYAPLSELVETGDEFRIRTKVSGFPARALHVSVLSDSIIIEGRAEKGTAQQPEKMQSGEFGQYILMRKFDLPDRIDPAHVQANLDHGILRHQTI
jgi:HSP20 family molecular chaperone IbpA